MALCWPRFWEGCSAGSASPGEAGLGAGSRVCGSSGMCGSSGACGSSNVAQLRADPLRVFLADLGWIWFWTEPTPCRLSLCLLLDQKPLEVQHVWEPSSPLGCTARAPEHPLLPPQAGNTHEGWPLFSQSSSSQSHVNLSLRFCLAAGFQPFYRIEMFKEKKNSIKIKAKLLLIFNLLVSEAVL